MDLVRPESLQGLFGDKYKKLPTDADRAAVALPAVALLLPLWMSGVPLREIEAAFLPSGKKPGRCEYARTFVSRIVQDLAFIAGLPTDRKSTSLISSHQCANSKPSSASKKKNTQNTNKKQSL